MYNFGECLDLLDRRLAEHAPSRIQLLTGPRQVGKTTVLLALAKRHDEQAIYVAADGPEAAVPGFWERLWVQVEEASRSRKIVLLLDEVQHLGNWAARLKGEWDRLRRKSLAVHIVATGSSALRLGAGSRESLAGRFERLTLTHWPAAALARTFGIGAAEAAQLFVRLGSFPGAFALRDDLVRWSAYVRDAIIEPALSRDILALAEVRRPALLRQVFALCAAAPAQILSLQKLQGRLQEAGALHTIAHYLQLLEEAYLVAPLEKYSTRLVRRRAAPPKLVTLNNAFLSVGDPRGIPDPAREPDRFGAWVENACLAYAWNSGQRVAYWREEPYEVDTVLEGSWGQWAVEVKCGSFGAEDLRGLLEFTRRNPQFRPLVLTGRGDQPRALAARSGVVTQSWSDFLLAGPHSSRP